jgi:two-component system chemotaxis response regulator CheY
MMKAIVIDDSRAARQQVANVLVGAGFEIVEAVDGNDGLEKINANADAKVVICDVNMPNLSGLELLAAVKASHPLGFPPFLMLTTEAQPELVQQAKKHGAKGWVIKPFKPELLLAAVRKLVG